MRDVSLWELHLFQANTRVSLPMLLLAFLLMNAGLGMQISPWRQWGRSIFILKCGVIGNLLIPLLFILFVSQVMRLWPNPDEVQNILVGLALVASMPVAGSSTAWSQNANGDMRMSLGLVLLSTLISPLATPIAFRTVGLMATGDYSEDLHELAHYGTGIFLALFVLLPALVGIALRCALTEERIGSIKPLLTLGNSFGLMLLTWREHDHHRFALALGAQMHFGGKTPLAVA
jgi:bile acid:Na+ symporter, BASS family